MSKILFPAARAISGALLVLALGCRASGSGESAARPALESDMALSKTAHPEVIKRFCGEPAGPTATIVKILKDSSGHIGGYTHTLQILDSPIYYLDARGDAYAMFHIFGSDEEKAKNGPLIDALRKAFPVEGPLVCP